MDTIPIYSIFVMNSLMGRVGRNISKLYANDQMDMPSIAHANGVTATAGRLRHAYSPSHT